MLPPNQKNKFNLSGGQLQSHLQSKPRKPMGQNAPQPIGNSGQPNTAGFQIDRPKMNAMPQQTSRVPYTPMRGAPDPYDVFGSLKYKRTDDPENMAPLMDGGMLRVEDTANKKMPSDMGMYGPPGSPNRERAEQYHANFKGNPMQRGPYAPNPNVNPRDNVQLLGTKNTPAGSPQMPAPHADANMLYLTKEQEREVFGSMYPPKLTKEQEQEILDGKMTHEKWNALRKEQGLAYTNMDTMETVWPDEAPPQTGSTKPATQKPQVDRGFYGLESDKYVVGGKPPKNPQFRPMKPEVDSQSPWNDEFEAKQNAQGQQPQGSPNPYQSALGGLDQRLVPGGQATQSDADEYRRVLGGLDQRLVPGGAMKQADANSGVSSMPPYASRPYNKTPEQAVRDFNTISPERQAKFDADVAKDREELQKRTEELNNNLGFTGASIGNQTDYLNKQADLYGTRADSAEAMNKRLDAGGGLQYKQASTGFGTPEEVSQAAGSLNAMAAADKAKQDMYNSEQDKVMSDWKQSKAAKDEYMRESMGTKNDPFDPDAARKDVNRLSGQFAAITKQGVAPGMKFTDFVQEEIRSGRLSPNSDALKIIEANYSHEFDKSPGQSAGMAAPAQSAIDMARAKAKEARDAGYSPGMTQAQRDGLDRRRAVAAQQGADRSNVANLIGQGLSPYEARQEVAAANLKQQEIMDKQAARNASLQADQLNFMQQQAMYNQTREQNKADRIAEFYARNPNAAIAGTPEYAQAQAMIAYNQGKPPADPTGGMMPPGGNRTPVQSQAMVNSIVGRVPDQVSDPKSPQAPAQIISFAQTNGLNAKEQVEVLSRTIGQPVNTKDGGRDFIKALVAESDAKAAEAGKSMGGGYIQSGSQEYIAAHRNSIASNMPVIKAIAEANGISESELNQIMNANKYGRIKDYWDTKSAWEAYGPMIFGPMAGGIL